MKSILERALVHLLNEENEKAEELLHQYVIETARSIHESLREGDDVEALDDVELEEDFFSEADLDDDADAADDEAAVELGDDLGEEVPEIADESDLTDDTLSDEGDLGDMGMDAEAAPEAGIEAEIEDFEEQLADLQAKFDAMVAEIEGEADDVADEVTDADPVLDADADADADAAADEDMGAEEDMSDDEDFDDITESIVDELQKVAAIDAEGKGATGQDLLGNKQSLKFNKPEAKPAASKGGEHKGFARETAPSSTALKGGKTVVGTSMRNVRKDADAGNHKAGNEGPKALLKTKAADKVDSTISGKPVGKK